MKHLRLILNICIFFCPAIVWANPFDSFIGTYKVTKVVESTCTYKTTPEYGPCGGGWNLDKLISVSIWKDDNPKSISYGQTLITTVALNATYSGVLKNEYWKTDGNYAGIQNPSFEHEIRLSSSYDGSSAIQFAKTEDKRIGSIGISSLQISKKSDGSFEFSFQSTMIDAGVNSRNGYTRQVYTVEKKN